MSRRLDALNAVLRRVAKPRLAATATPAQAAREFDLSAKIFLRRPAGLRRVVEPGAPDIHWISAGPTDAQRVILHFHGGAYISGSPKTHSGLLGRLSQLSGLRVAAPAYRLAPDHPAPAQFEDARAAHAALLGAGIPAGQIVLGGDSAGGGLALALLADLCARDLRPAGAYAFSPWADLTLSGDSLRENADRDPLLPVERIEEVVGYVLGEIQADDPRVSPLFAGFSAPPPAQIHVGTTEILRDDARRMARHLETCGGAVLLREWSGAPHLWPIFDGYIPEARAALRDVAAFIGTLPA